MTTPTQSAPTSILPPIRADLVDDLMLHAKQVTPAEVHPDGRGTLPDIVNLTAKLTLCLLILCMYVPLLRDFLG